MLALVLGCMSAMLVTGCETESASQKPNTWEELKPSGSLPSPRAGQAMVYDADTGRALVFGGFSTDGAGGEGPEGLESARTLGDTWAFDPAAKVWIELAANGSTPPARWSHAMVYDPREKKVILFGGVESADKDLGDLWAYDPAADAWTELEPAGARPTARGGHSMVYDPIGGRVLLFGGLGLGPEGGTGELDDTWAYDPAANAWTELAPTGPLPSARVGQAMTYDSDTGKVILFGGQSPSVSVSGDVLSIGPPQTLDDTWAYDPATNSWTELKPSGSLPAPRTNHTAVYAADARRVILFGGMPRGSGYDALFGDTWAYDPAANSWSELKPSGNTPSAREAQSMVYGSPDGKVILFGGMWIDKDSRKFGFYADTWMYTPAR